MSGPKNPHAVALGRVGGSKKSKRKAEAVRENGKRGGRPALCGYQPSFPRSRGCRKKAVKDGYCEVHQ